MIILRELNNMITIPFVIVLILFVIQRVLAEGYKLKIVKQEEEIEKLNKLVIILVRSIPSKRSKSSNLILKRVTRDA